LVAAVMAAHPHIAMDVLPIDVAAFIA
jgi:hypothetical protein